MGGAETSPTTVGAGERGSGDLFTGLGQVSSAKATPSRGTVHGSPSPWMVF